ncbi:MAG: 30S ribosomal protein S20 [Holosporales bacterium]|jgi:small subunit ribosomal protein S20|nr:30S ribosomal protein S20 [Holosporales bacterium]
MPSHKSAEKAVRQIEKRTRVNKARISRIRTFVKKVELAVSSFGKDPKITPEFIKQALVSAERELMRGAGHGVMHKNAAARKVSRLAQKARKTVASASV